MQTTMAVGRKAIQVSDENSSKNIGNIVQHLQAFRPKWLVNYLSLLTKN